MRLKKNEAKLFHLSELECKLSLDEKNIQTKKQILFFATVAKFGMKIFAKVLILIATKPVLVFHTKFRHVKTIKYLVVSRHILVVGCYLHVNDKLH